MPETKYLKCTCSQCGGHIEFPAEGVGMTATCPHCGWETELTLESPTEAPARASRSPKWIIAGAVILVIGLVSSVSAVLLAKKLIHKRGVQRLTAQSSARLPKTNTGSGVPIPAREPRGEMINGFSTSEVKIQKTSGSSLVYATGTIKNETEKQRFGVTVEIDLLDSAGKKIGTAKDYKDTVEPHAQWSFRALLVKKETAAARIAAINEQ